MATPQGFKSEGTATLLDFLWPGVGHLWASEGKQGLGLLIANIVCGLTVPFVYVTFLGNVALWIYAMVTASGVAREHNDHIARATGLRQVEERQREADQQKTQQQLKHQEEEKRLEVSGVELAQELLKLENLLKMNIINDEEFSRQKAALLDGLLGRKTSLSMGDFFLPLGDMVQRKLLTSDELNRLKTLYQTIAAKKTVVVSAAVPPST